MAKQMKNAGASLGFQSQLWAAADKLRNSRESLGTQIALWDMLGRFLSINPACRTDVTDNALPHVAAAGCVRAGTGGRELHGGRARPSVVIAANLEKLGFGGGNDEQQR